MSITDFLAMGGYAEYVWSCYGLSLVALALNIILPKLKEQKTIQTLTKEISYQNDN